MLQTVTCIALPLLVTAEGVGKKFDGWGTFFPGDHAGSMAVRIVKPADVQARLKTIFTPKEITTFAGSIALRQAYDSGDEYSLTRAYKQLGIPFPKEINIHLKTKGGVPISIQSRGSQKWRETQWRYSGLMSQEVKRVRFVVWYSEAHKGFLPALYCPDWKAAAYAMTFMGLLRICPHCGIVFTGGELYCCPAHGIAYRTARSRAKQRVKAKGESSKG